MMIANYTPDDIKWMHVGVTGTLKADQVEEFEGGRAKFILNKFGQRGLLKMDFGDEEAEKREIAMELYTEFWTRQIANFNMDNIARNNEQRAYVAPQKLLIAKAEELGIPLESPWAKPAGTNDAEVSALRAEMKEMHDMMKTLTKSAGDAASKYDDVLRGQFLMLKDPDDFRSWLMGSLGDVMRWPEHIQAEVKAIWDDTQGKEIYPLMT